MNFLDENGLGRLWAQIILKLNSKVPDGGTTGQILKKTENGTEWADGKSAYTAAQEGGYAGTEAEFNAALASTPGHIADSDIHVTNEEKTAWSAKQDTLIGTQGQVVGFDADGNPVAQDIPSGSGGDMKKSTYDTKNVGVDIYNYIGSRGENLITNGTGLLKSNYNWSQFDYDPTDTYFANGCFSKENVIRYQSFVCDELLPVNMTGKFKFDFYSKCNVDGAQLSGILQCYDIDGKPIRTYQTTPRAGTLTFLTQPLKHGDTVVHLNDVSGFNTTTTAAQDRSLLFWGYANSYGYVYDDETYTQWIFSDLWGDGAIDVENNTITLASPWSNRNPEFEAGHHVSQGMGGAGANYVSNDTNMGFNDWAHHTFHFGGIQNKNEFPSGKFQFGTAYFKVGFMCRPSAHGSNVKISTITVTQQSDIADNVKDVQINGSSIVKNGVVNIPIAGKDYGVIKSTNTDGVYISPVSGYISAIPATDAQIANRSTSYNVITPTNLDSAVKAAMCDGKGAAWTDDEKAAARIRMGTVSSDEVSTMISAALGVIENGAY